MNFEFNDATIRIGAHISKNGTLIESILPFASTKYNCAQIYLGSSRTHQPPNLDQDDLALCRRFVDYSLFKVYVHGCLLYNMNGGTHIDTVEQHIKNAKTDKQKQKFVDEKNKIPHNYEKMHRGLVIELDACAKAFGTGVVVHIGSGEDKPKAIERIAKTVQVVLTAKTIFDPKKRCILLENAAGEGNKIGSTLQEISQIMNKIQNKEQVFVCIDTCHLFAAGEYNIEFKEEFDRFLKDFDSLIGLSKLKLIHLNDSKKPFGCKVDRHETLRKGHIFSSTKGLESLQYIVKFANKNKIDMILETPPSHDDEVDLVYELSQN